MEHESQTENGTVNRKYKATLFSVVFQGKKELLSLYNALSGDHCTSEDELELNTLGDEEGYETGFYLKLHNDLSFIVHHELNVYEHQSTWSFNMPLRMFMYVGDIYKSELRKRQSASEPEKCGKLWAWIYKHDGIRIPAPRFVVFYNGVENIEDKKQIRLSSLYAPEVLDRYKDDESYPFLELTVTAYNINYGHNKKLMESCQRLKEYSEFVDRARNALYHLTDENAKMKAMKEVVEKCIEDNILRDFLMNNREAVIHMEFYGNEIELREMAARSDGYDDGYEEGLDEGSFLRLFMQLKVKVAQNKSVSDIAEELIETPENIEILMNLLKKHPNDPDPHVVYEEYKAHH